jgi:hypothetical protein
MSIENPQTFEEEEDPDGLTPEQRATANAFKGYYRERPFPGQRLREYEEDVVGFKELIAAFKDKHSLEELLDITELTPAEAPFHPVREPARLDLIPIVQALKTMWEETTINMYGKDLYRELEAEYRILSRAVGMINNNKVRHD